MTLKGIFTRNARPPARLHMDLTDEEAVLFTGPPHGPAEKERPA